MTLPASSALSLRTLWERDSVSRDGAETALVVTITASSERPTSTDRAPLDIAFALDRSGSMGGDPIELVKEAVIAATHHLGEADRLSLVVFDNEVDVLHDLSPATFQSKARVQRVLNGVDARGGTHLSSGWLTACQQLATNPPMTAGRAHLQRTLLLTDGMANGGITDPAQLATHAAELRARGISTTTIGVGRHFDEMLLSSMAEAGGGTFQYIAEAKELRDFFAREIGELLDIVALRPTLTITFPEGMHARLVNAFPVRRNGPVFTIDLRDLASRDDLSLVFDIRVKAGQGRETLVPSLKLDWTHPPTGQQMGMHRELDALRLTDAETALRTPRNDDAAGPIALERAARDHREAIRLDREGRFAESRERFGRGVKAMMSAPMTDELQEEIRVSKKLASADFSPLDEHTRKSRVSAVHSRSRGRRRE